MNLLIVLQELGKEVHALKHWNLSPYTAPQAIQVLSIVKNHCFIETRHSETFRKNLLRKYQNPSCWHLSTWIELIFTTFCTLFKMTLTFVSFSSFHLAVILPLSNCHRLSLWPIFHSISPFSIMLSHRQHTPNFLWQKSTVNSTSCIT